MFTDPLEEPRHHAQPARALERHTAFELTSVTTASTGVQLCLYQRAG